jgi:hypothetical protein
MICRSRSFWEFVFLTKMAMLPSNQAMNLSEEKQKLYARLHEWMYQESIRTNHTPLPKELEDPKEWEAFVEWRHENWRRLGRKAVAAFDEWYDSKYANEATPALAEEPPPYRSKK